MASHFLLPEILSQIFSFCHINDRKSVRLVCRTWYDCCNCPAILRKEKFVFRVGYSLQNLNLFLQNCGEQLRNAVEFQGVSLDQLSDDIWQIIGEKIHSLALITCSGSSEVIKNIFLYCPNMHSIRFRSDLVGDTFHLSVWLDKLIELDIVRQKMMYFQLNDAKRIELAKYEDQLWKIFKIFPCIRNFGIGYLSYQCNYYFEEIPSYQGSLSNIFNPALIKEISFNIPCKDSWLKGFSSVPELKLQKLEIILVTSSTLLESFPKFLQSQTELRTLKLRFVEITIAMEINLQMVPMLLFKILSICLELVDFRVKCDDIILKVDKLYSLLQTVSKSKLECFMVWFTPHYNNIDDPTFKDNFSTYLPPLINKTLRVLKLDSEMGLKTKYCLPILKHFCNLHHLDISAKSDKVLETICKYHINLQTLVLRWVQAGDCDSDYVLAQETSQPISQLRELTHLDLEVVGDPSQCWIEKILRQLCSPLLKYFRLSFWDLEEEIDLFDLPNMIPSVEVLILDGVFIPDYQYIRFSNEMQRLKVIKFHLIRHKRVIRDMFDFCPSLRYAMDSNDKAYSYDPISDSINLVNFSGLEFKRNVFCDFICMPMDEDY